MLFIDCLVVVVMSEQPVVVIRFFLDPLQKTGECIWGKIRVQLLLDTGGSAVRNDIAFYSRGILREHH